jgi:hypothetical protein
MKRQRMSFSRWTLFWLLAGVLPSLGQYELKSSSFTILRQAALPPGNGPAPTRPQFASVPPTSGGSAVVRSNQSASAVTVVAAGGSFGVGNLATAGTAFAKDVIAATPHSIAALNNGSYGNASSWISASANSFAGINLGATPMSVNRIAFGRDNTGGFTDRSVAIYTLQYTTTPNPNAATTSWTTIGTLDYGNTTLIAQPATRHLIAFPTVQATGIRVLMNVDGIAIDEIELYNATTVSAAFPKGGKIVNGTAQTSVQAIRITFGGSFAPGVPRYFMGDEITAPLVTSGNLAATPGYWRKEPLRAGELVQHPNSTSETPVAANTTLNYYYSRHAKRVFAHKPGRVGVTWVSATAPPGGRYDIFTEFFNVSSASTKPVRAMYWTKRDFSTPPVTITSNRVTTVNPMFYSGFPATVAQEYSTPSAPNPYPGSPLLGTLWAEAIAGTFQLHSYNVEGRIMVEYLGATQQDGSLEFLGADIVDVSRAPEPQVNTVQIGERMLPHDGDAELIPQPVLNLSNLGPPYYFQNVQEDNTAHYYAERENTTPDRVAFHWQENLDAGVHFLSANQQPGLTITWPKYLDRYIIIWPQDLGGYVTTLAPSGGTTTVTGLRFASGKLPDLVHQDDISQTQAVVDAQNQRFTVALGSDTNNRSLLRFTEGSKVWYIRVFTQDANAPGFQDRLYQEIGTEVAGTPLTNLPATVGQPIQAPSPAYEAAGYIAEGTGYYAAGYINPNTGTDFSAAGKSVIIPVNAKPGMNSLTVWWFREVTPPDAAFSSFYVPAKKAIYQCAYPSNAREIVLASNAGSGELSAEELGGSLYFQNDANQPGYNPNEEHAMLLAGRVYALRDDLNITSGAGYTSLPFALLAYTKSDGVAAMSVFRVLRESGTHTFSYPWDAASIIQPPMPLPLLPLALDATGNSKNTEVLGIADPRANTSSPALWDKFTFKDRKGYSWCYRGPHTGGSPSFGMKFWYPMQAGFFVPGVGSQPAPGTPLPYLRPIVSGSPAGDAVNGDPQVITYLPRWPEGTPTLQMGETLTLPKFGLPAVRGQTSAKVLYQQSLAQTVGAESVRLHDPTRAKKFALGSSGGALQSIPAAIATTSKAGKTYFQLLPPHLQQRVYFDRNQGTKGSLVFNGQFVDEVTGEDYLHLNVLSQADVAALKGLVPAGNTDKSKWDAAIDGLVTQVETFIENPSRAGTYMVDTFGSINATELAFISNSDTAVDSYALTALGRGQGYVTMLFGDGEAFTPQGEPVVMKIVRVVPQLYTGQVKALTAANPLDEKVTLRHTGDFAALPEDYEFDWRYSPPADGRAPSVYQTSMQTHINSGSQWWSMRNDARLPTLAQLNQVPAAYGQTLLSGNTSNVIRNVAYSPTGAVPGLTLTSVAAVDFSVGPTRPNGVPNSIIFSARLGEFDGLVLYVNGLPALSYNAPAAYASIDMPPQIGLDAAALPLQWQVDRQWFSPSAANTIAVRLFTTADAGSASVIDFKLQAAAEVDVVATSGWLSPSGTLSNIVTTGGGPTAPLGNPLLVMTDNYFVMRYRPKVGRSHLLAPGASQAAVPWSRWISPVLVEGWIKRVLAGINPFNQRTDDFFNNAVNTDVSLLTQAGKRWEGDVALNLENINDFGLIEIYETVLNRGKNISIDSGYDYGPANDALLLAAGYLNDLYIILGHEAFADAANPTISIDDQSSSTEVNTSRFSFEGQLASSLEEELALLRGRDDSLSPGVQITPAYNRLYWNYTRGINSGEALYAVNYNIKEKVGGSAYDGTIDAADAQYMFPQGHGDAYGHYLTALKGYYHLLTSPNFTWIPRTEAVTVLGQPVQVDYKDERKFAAAASSLASAARQIISLIHRQSYRDDPAEGWESLHDSQPTNTSTGITRKWGLDEWSARSGTGTYVNWIVANAMLPDVDTNPAHTGIQKIDRSTVPELQELVAAGESIQTTLDNANAHLNPLGLSPGAIAFDISPSELQSGSSHYDQLHTRALRAVLNARGSFNQAAIMTRSLRNQANTLDDYYSTIFDTELAYNTKLKAIFGVPYPADIGPGKVYAQGYGGPDLVNWIVIDRSSDFVTTAQPVAVTIRRPIDAGSSQAFAFTLDQNAAVNLIDFATNKENFYFDTRTLGLGIKYSTLINTTKKINFEKSTEQLFSTRTALVQPGMWGAYADTFFNGTTPGVRSQVGRVQTALAAAQSAYFDILRVKQEMDNLTAQFGRDRELFNDLVTSNENIREVMLTRHVDNEKTATAATLLRLDAALNEAIIGGIGDIIVAASDAPPKAVGVAPDVTSAPRTVIKVIGYGIKAAGALRGAISRGIASKAENDNISRRFYYELDIEKFGMNYAEKQLVHEMLLRFDEMRTSEYKALQVFAAYQTALENLRNVIAEGDQILSERETFRKRAAAIIQGYRTKDLTFRAFRNEALEQYRSLYDLAARYTYLSAKSYDYETGLLGTTQGQSVLNSIIASRALGDLTGDIPQATVSTLGDAGLAGTMARLQADWSVVKGRLGINNAGQNSTLFSMRHELFRITKNAATTQDDDAWSQVLEQHIRPNILTDADVAAHCLSVKKTNNTAVPGFVIPFSTTIEDGTNLFGLPLAAGDHTFNRSSFSTKVWSLGVVLDGYVGMDSYASGNPNGAPASSAPNALAATPYIYLIPCGADRMWAPPLGDQSLIRTWNVHDQALPLPFNLGGSAFSANQFFSADGTLTSQPWIVRKHPAFRPVSDPTLFYGSFPQEFTNTRLIGRSVWNTQWKLVIPAHLLLSNEQDAMNRFIASVKDIQLFLRTYSYSGN